MRTKNIKIICAGCYNRYPVESTVVYRKKRCCGNKTCYDVIDKKVTNFNYRKQQKKIETGKFRHGVNPELREYIKNRDNMLCRMCFESGESVNLQVHHIVPVSDGGNDDKTNLILLCHNCHNKVHKNGYDKYINTFTKYSFVAESVTQ